jgi:hypothetical protein
MLKANTNPKIRVSKVSIRKRIVFLLHVWLRFVSVFNHTSPAWVKSLLISF